MPSPDTLAKIHRGLDRLRAAQAAGEAPAPGDVSGRLIAELSGISPAAWSNYERMIKAKFLTGLLRNADDDLQPRVASYLREQLRTLIHEP